MMKKRRTANEGLFLGCETFAQTQINEFDIGLILSEMWSHIWVCFSLV